MNINVSLCDTKSNEYELNLPYDKFKQIWENYLELPSDRNLFSSKEIIDAIDMRLDPDYNIKQHEADLLSIIRKLEDICVMGIVNKDSICLKVEK